MSNVPTDVTTNLKLAEQYYRTAISIRPKYWDASINLAGLLSTQRRWNEAIEVYQSIEGLIESEFDDNERFDTLTLQSPAINTAAASVTGADLKQVMECDAAFASLLCETEHRKHKRIAFLRASGGVVSGEASGFTTERRRDLYFAKGNLLFATNNFVAAKQEYFKGLVSVGIKLDEIFEGSTQPTIPSQSITPEQAAALVRQKPLHSDPMHHPTTSSILQTLAKIYQDCNILNVAIKFYYLSLSIYPTANTCNNLGILLAPQRIHESVQWYEFGLTLDPNHVHLYTNLGSALKDRGLVDEGIAYYQRAVALQPDFYIALANLANIFKDVGRVDEAIDLYRRALAVKPDFIEAFCNFVNSLLFVCSWDSRTKFLGIIRDIVTQQLADTAKSVPRGIPTVLPFHTFTYSSLPAWIVREISRRNAERIFWTTVTSDWFPGFPERPRTLGHRTLTGQVAGLSDDQLTAAMNRALQYPYPYPVVPRSDRINIGYVSSDFTNHPLAHLMQSVFGLHDKQRFRVFCYSLSPSDGSPYRETIERGSDVFLDVSQWSTQQIVERIATVDHIHILCNLNGYTKGGRNGIFAARPAPIQIALMGFAGTMGAGRVNDPEHPDATNPDELSEDEGYGGDEEYDGELPSPDEDDTGAASFFDNLKTRWIDYMVADEIACPQKFVCGEPLAEDEVVSPNKPLIERGPISKDDDRNRIYTEGMIYMPRSYFVNDHRQGFREPDCEDIERILRDLSVAEAPSPSMRNRSLIDGVDAMQVSSSITSGLVETVPPELDSAGMTLDELVRWRREQMQRLKMRHELFPWLAEDTIVFANFNQLYKVDPDIFATWMRILERVPNSILWLLRFPPAGEAHLRRRAVEIVGEEASRRLIFTDVAPKHMHIQRGRIADIFLDTPECNAHTTAADILWSGTPIVTYPKYDFKMCSRVAASVAYATGKWHPSDRHYVANGDRSVHGLGIDIDLPRLRDANLLGHYMVVNSYQEYEDRVVMLAQSMRWGWVPIAVWRQDNYNLPPPMLPKSNSSSGISVSLSQGSSSSQGSSQSSSSKLSSVFGSQPVFYPTHQRPTHIFVPHGLAVDLRRRLFLTRDTMPLFDTPRWVKNLESGLMHIFERWERNYDWIRRRNQAEFLDAQVSLTDNRRRRSSASVSTTSTLISTPNQDSGQQTLDSHSVRRTSAFGKSKSATSLVKRAGVSRCYWIEDD